MNAENMITLICAMLVFMGTCITAAVTVKKSNDSVKSEMASIRQEVAKNREHDKEQYLAILRLTVMAEEMPVSERIIAGKKYIDEGGNGDVSKFYYEHLLPEHTK